MKKTDKMKNNMVKRLLALGMVVTMLAGCGDSVENAGTSAQSTGTGSSTQPQKEEASSQSQQSEESAYPEYLNMDGYRPIVKEGEEVTLTMMILRDSSSVTAPEDTWFYRFIEEDLNINLEVEAVTSENVKERKNLMMMSGDMPDIMAYLGFSTSDVMKYGVEEGLLLPISDYFDEQLTPNLIDTLEKNEDARLAATTPDGKIYTMPVISAARPGYGSALPEDRMFVDTKYLEAAGITELPDTLDGFIDMLRTFKAMDPATMGVDEIWPLVSTGGGLNGLDRAIFVNAFGWAMKRSDSFVDPVWDVEAEEIVIPAFQEKYGDYLEVMHTLHAEGLIHPDYFTIDATAARALMTERKTPVLADAAHYITQPEKWNEYIGIAALKSDWCEDGLSTRSFNYSLGNFFVSADTEYPELCVRFIDYLYSPEGSTYSTRGTFEEDTKGMIPGLKVVLKEDGTMEVTNDPENFAEEYGDIYQTTLQWRNDVIKLFTQPYFNEDIMNYAIYEHEGYEYQPPELVPTKRDNHYRMMMVEAAGDHMEVPLPGAYMASDKIERYTDLRTVISNHVYTESAKFVVGQRPLSELDDFFAELEAIGSEEYGQIAMSPFENYTRPVE